MSWYSLWLRRWEVPEATPPLPCLQKPGKAVACVECLCVCERECVCRELAGSQPALYTEPGWLPGRLRYSTAKTRTAAKDRTKLLPRRRLRAGVPGIRGICHTLYFSCNDSLCSVLLKNMAYTAVSQISPCRWQMQNELGVCVCVCVYYHTADFYCIQQ